MVRASSQPVVYEWLASNDFDFNIYFGILREAGRPAASRFAWAISGILPVRDWPCSQSKIKYALILTRMLIRLRK
jgi:hypothetical protein